MEEAISVEGPVLKVNGELVLFIPLGDETDEWMESARGISKVQREFFKISIPAWLAVALRLEEGDLVCVRKAGGIFRIGPGEPRQVH